MSRDTVKLDFALQFYVHRQYFQIKLHGMPKPKLYWNTDRETPTAINQPYDMPGCLERGWLLVPAAGGSQLTSLHYIFFPQIVLLLT